MATNTLIQYLQTERFSAFPGGASEGVPLEASSRRQVEVYLAGEALNAGDAVSLDFVTGGLTDGQRAIQVVQSSTAGTRTAFVGIVEGPANVESDDGSGGVVQGGAARVVVRGLVEANVLAHAQGDTIGASGTAGSLDTIGAAGLPCAVGVDGAGAPGVATVYVLHGMA